jgi:two-component system cell cycle sensor histidine kinase/response regulator CckA
MNRKDRKINSLIGFREKLIGTICLLTSILILILYLLIYTKENQIIDEKLKQNTIFQSKVMSSALQTFLLDQDTLKTYHILNNLINNHSIIYAQLYDQYGKKFSEVIQNEEIFQLAQKKVPFDIDKSSVTVINDTLYDIIKPITFNDNLLGFFRLGIDNSEMKQQLQSNQNFYVLIFILVLIIGISLSILLGKYLDKPIRRLARQTNEIIRGNSHYKLDISTNDELGKLARAFNTLAKKWEESEIELKSYQKSLELKIAEQNKILRESEEKYRNLVETSPDIIFIIQDSRIVFSNNRVKDLFDVSADELYNELVENLDFIILEDRKKLKTKIDSISPSDSQVYQLELNANSKQGKEYILDLSIYRIQYNNQPAFQCIIRDVTKRRKFENDLLQIQKMESIGTLASGIAHDFNNILGVIVPNAELIKNMSEPESIIYKEAEQIESVAIKASELTNKLLSFTRKDKLKIEIINPNTIISNLIKLISRLIGKDISISVYLDPNMKNIAVDVNHIEQVILNIALNARDAMPHGGKLIFKSSLINNLNLPDLTPGKEYCLLEIIDTGVGMDEDTRQRIFEPFFTTKAAGEGTGLGLSTVYAIIKNHQGYISVDSNIGAGSKFNIYLPTTPQESTADETAILSLDYIGEGKILVIEDDIMMLETIKNLLGHLGYDVITALNGKQAIEIFNDAKDKIKLIILDLEMPLMNGIETLRKLKEIDDSVKVLISTGHIMENKVEEAMKEGAIAYLKKPYRITDLAKTIRNSIGTEDIKS